DLRSHRRRPPCDFPEGIRGAPGGRPVMTGGSWLRRERRVRPEPTRVWGGDAAGAGRGAGRRGRGAGCGGGWGGGGPTRSRRAGLGVSPYAVSRSGERKHIAGPGVDRHTVSAVLA